MPSSGGLSLGRGSSDPATSSSVVEGEPDAWEGMTLEAVRNELENEVGLPITDAEVSLLARHLMLYYEGEGGGDLWNDATGLRQMIKGATLYIFLRRLRYWRTYLTRQYNVTVFDTASNATDAVEKSVESQVRRSIVAKYGPERLGRLDRNLGPLERLSLWFIHPWLLTACITLFAPLVYIAVLALYSFVESRPESALQTFTDQYIVIMCYLVAAMVVCALLHLSYAGLRKSLRLVEHVRTWVARTDMFHVAAKKAKEILGWFYGMITCALAYFWNRLHEVTAQLGRIPVLLHTLLFHFGFLISFMVALGPSLRQTNMRETIVRLSYFWKQCLARTLLPNESRCDLRDPILGLFDEEQNAAGYAALICEFCAYQLGKLHPVPCEYEGLSPGCREPNLEERIIIGRLPKAQMRLPLHKPPRESFFAKLDQADHNGDGHFSLEEAKLLTRIIVRVVAEALDLDSEPIPLVGEAWAECFRTALPSAVATAISLAGLDSFCTCVLPDSTWAKARLQYYP